MPALRPFRCCFLNCCQRWDVGRIGCWIFSGHGPDYKKVDPVLTSAAHQNPNGCEYVLPSLSLEVPKMDVLSPCNLNCTNGSPDRGSEAQHGADVATRGQVSFLW